MIIKSLDKYDVIVAKAIMAMSDIILYTRMFSEYHDVYVITST